jgi:hypothetical protein
VDRYHRRAAVRLPQEAVTPFDPHYLGASLAERPGPTPLRSDA